MFADHPPDARVRPKYHDAMLIVRVRETLAAPAAPGGAAHAMRAMVAGAGRGFDVAAQDALQVEAPGLAALSMLERGGLVKRVTPLGRATSTRRVMAGPRRAMAGLMAAAATPSDGMPSGVCMIELERHRDVDGLQRALADDAYVEYVSRVPVRYHLAKRPVAAAGPVASTMWNLRKIEWNTARRRRGFRDATKVKVAVLDSGIDATHPDLDGVVSSYVFDYPGAGVPTSAKDIIGHGTHVAGTIAARINNRLGVNGICRCSLRVWKIFSDQTTFISEDEGFGYVVDPIMYRQALADCFDEDVDVINLSIGGEGEPDAQEAQLLAKLQDNGTTIVAAMGNEREWGSPISYPAASPGVIAVGATSLDDSVASFSNRGPHITLSAPGTAIWSTLPTYPGQWGFKAVPDGRGHYVEGRPSKREVNYAAWEGTSMATPHVTAAAALLIAKRGRQGPQKVLEALAAKADVTPGMGGGRFHQDYGHGRLNLLRLLG